MKNSKKSNLDRALNACRASMGAEWKAAFVRPLQVELPSPGTQGWKLITVAHLQTEELKSLRENES